LSRPPDVEQRPGDERAELEEAVHIERHNSIAPVPEEYKDATPLDQFWIWAGANIAPINWVLGALGIVLGLGFWDTVLVLALGNAIGVVIFGAFVLMGQRTGVTQMVLTRSAFGRRGAYFPAFFQIVIATGWIAINTWIILDLSVALLEKLGISGTPSAKVVVVLVLMAIQVGLATLGFYAIRTFEKWTVPITLVILVAMSIVAWSSGEIQWGFAGEAEGRFTPRTVPRSRLFWAGALGQFIPVLWLGVLGASIATTGTGADPAVIIVNTFGALAVPVLFLVLHGPIATNILNVYSTSVSALAVDINVRRHVLTIIVGVFATAFTIYLVFAGSLAEQLDAWLATVVAWASPWAAIMLVHYYIIKRENIDIEALYQSPSESRVGDVNWAAIICLIVGLVMTWLFLYGLVAPLQGPIARALNGLDLSWLAGMLTAGLLYYALYRLGMATPQTRIREEPGESPRVDRSTEA
jgi:NCS1 family nucleobase:cation symporter-1